MEALYIKFGVILIPKGCPNCFLEFNITQNHHIGIFLFKNIITSLEDLYIMYGRMCYTKYCLHVLQRFYYYRPSHYPVELYFEFIPKYCSNDLHIFIFSILSCEFPTYSFKAGISFQDVAMQVLLKTCQTQSCVGCKL